MLDQIIYTRCSPQRDLENKGQVKRNDGFGVYSLSPELYQNKGITTADCKNLFGRLAVPNGAREQEVIGLISSYEYAMASENVFYLSYEVARPKCMIPRKNGMSHRPGTYIKQCFVGEIEGYPAEWFGASAWDAHLKTENDYYIDNDPNAEPPFLQRVSSMPQNGYINAERVKRFVNEGRAEAVKAGIWFLLQEFEKPEGERKILLIKDIPENVELWIAAIEYGFSAPMARKITFTTNRSGLGANGSSVLFYYTDATGRISTTMNRSIQQERHPYNMIVGYHPDDKRCIGVRPMTTSGFVIIDGTQKTISFQPDNSIQMPYYSAVVRYDADIQDFCNVVLPSLPLKELTGKVPELFDAYKYLLDSNHKAEKWEYSETIRYLNALLQFGVPNNPALSGYLIDESLKVWQHFAGTDETHDFALLKYMWSLAKAAGKEPVVTACAAKSLRQNLGNLTARNNGLAHTWKAMKSAGVAAIVQPTLRELFGDAELVGYAKQFKNCDAESMDAVLDLFFWKLTTEGEGVASIAKSNEKYNFICLSIVILLDDPPRLTALLKILSVIPDLFNRIVLSIAEYLDKSAPARGAAWWDMVMDMSGESVQELCRQLCSAKSANIVAVEQLLTNRLEKTHRMDAGLEKAFSESIELLGKNLDTGSLFFSAWIRNSSPNELGGIIRAIEEYDLSTQVEEKLFVLADARMLCEIFNGTTPVAYQKVKQWASLLGKTSKGVEFYEFRRALEREKKVENVVGQAHLFAEKNFSVEKTFLSSQYFANLVSCTAEFYDADLHIAMLCLFQNTDEATLEQYVDAYVEKVIAETKNRYLVEQLVSLYEASTCKFNVPGRTEVFVNGVQDMMNDVLGRQLEECYKPNLADQVSKYMDCERNVKVKLIKKLDEISEKKKNKGVRGIFGKFNNLFGKH